MQELVWLLLIISTNPWKYGSHARAKANLDPKLRKVEVRRAQASDAQALPVHDGEAQAPLHNALHLHDAPLRREGADGGPDNCTTKPWVPCASHMNAAK